jgi:glyoxylase-like metal-dependent hydrolase (beta-lactamase superfamily II)
VPQPISVGDRRAFALNDGIFRAPVGYFDDASVFELLQSRQGSTEYPVGAFLWPGDRTVLIDAGVGPVDYGGRGALVGGSLLDELRATGHGPGDVDVLALSHLHPDHAGWVASADGEPTFPNATVVVGVADWQHFVVERRSQIEDHLVHALTELHAQGRVELCDGEQEVSHGLRLLPAPGHTPGHSVFVMHDHDDRVLLLGDAVLCPLQLTERDFSVISDLDKAMARRTRERIARELERHSTRGVGCHFPGLMAGRLLSRTWMPDRD